MRFRISTLVPANSKAIVEQISAISMINQDESGELCYIVPNYEYSEIGIYITSSDISFFSEKSDTFPIESCEDIPSIIAKYCELLPKNTRKIGVIEKNITIREYPLHVGCFAACRDVDAFALMNHDTLHAHCLIAVIEDEGIRSAVIIGGKLFSSGNIANLKNQEPAVAISTLLSLFGPGTVVINGIDLEKLTSRARLLVPAKIWNQSQIIVSDFTLTECAARLHYLLYKYKASL